MAHFRSSLLVVVIINQLLQGAGCSVCLSVRTPFGGLELGNGRYGKKLRDIWPIPRAACSRLLVLQLSEIRAFSQVFLFAIVHRHSFAFNLRLDVFNFFWNLFSRKKRANQQNSITRSLPTAHTAADTDTDPYTDTDLCVPTSTYNVFYVFIFESFGAAGGLFFDGVVWVTDCDFL